MQLVADAVHQLRGFPSHAVNVYLVEDVLIDAGTPLARRRILRQLRGRALAAHALTHAHPDHFGSSHAVCEALGIPLWCGERDAEAVETGEIPASESPFKALAERLPGPPPHPVARRLREGDEVAGFRVLDTPGHSHALVLFGHWPPLRDARRFVEFGPRSSSFGFRRRSRPSPGCRARSRSTGSAAARRRSGR